MTPDLLRIDERHDRHVRDVQNESAPPGGAPIMNTPSRKDHVVFNHVVSIGLLLFLLSTASGQTSVSPSSGSPLLRIGIAGLHDQVKDHLIAPLRWDGIGGGLWLSYMVPRPTLEHEIDLLLPVSFLSNRYDHKAYAFGASLGYSRLWLMDPSVLGGNLYLGGQVRWSAHCQFYADWDDSHVYWLGVYGFSPSLKWSKGYESKQKVSITMEVPLLALVSRPPDYQYTDQPPLQRLGYYFEALHHNLKMTSVNEYVSLGLKADYSGQIGERTMLGATWLFKYTTCKFPQTLSMISNTLTINYVIIL